MHANNPASRLRRAALAASVLLATPAMAQDDPAARLRPLVDRIVGAAAGAESIPGVIVGISWRGQRSYYAYGGPGGAPYDRNTIVEIGSITKVFTTALFAEAVREGRMR